jgi:hypothetical protein
MQYSLEHTTADKAILALFPDPAAAEIARALIAAGDEELAIARLGESLGNAPPAALGTLSLPFASQALRNQVARVMQSIDATGAPPIGIYQGGWRGIKGLYANEGPALLPARPLGYYGETGLWPNPQIPHRLVWGRGGEVYFSYHYQWWVRIR